MRSRGKRQKEIFLKNPTVKYLSWVVRAVGKPGDLGCFHSKLSINALTQTFQKDLILGLSPVAVLRPPESLEDSSQSINRMWNCSWHMPTPFHQQNICEAFQTWTLHCSTPTREVREMRIDFQFWLCLFPLSKTPFVLWPPCALASNPNAHVSH